MSGLSDKFGAMIPYGRYLGASPLSPILRPHVRFVPIVALLGLVASLLESVGIGALIPLFALMTADSLPSGLPGPVRWVTRTVGRLDPHEQAFTLGGAVLLIILLKSVVQAANNVLLARVHANINRDIMKALAARILALDYGVFLENKGPRALTVLGQTSWWLFEAVRSVLLIAQASAGVVVFGVILIWLDWRLSAVAAGGALLVIALLSFFERLQRRRSAGLAEQSSEMVQRAREITGGARVVRLFGQEARERARFDRAARLAFKEYFALNRIAGLVTPSFDFMIAGIFTAILLVSYALKVPLPQVTAFLVLILRAQPQVGQITMARTALAAQSASVAEAEWLLSQRITPAPPPGAVAITAIDQPIRFESVDFFYPDGAAAVTQASFTIKPGCVTALIGQSGAGKTTVINLLCGLIRPHSGSIRLGDMSLDRIDSDAWRTHIAIAGQDVALFEGTIAENIAYACPSASADEIAEAARAAGALVFISALPQGMATPVGSGGQNLSGGQRQRIGLARALIKRPDLLILDEATSAVDALTENEIVALLAERRHFRTALVISHRRNTLASCSEGIVIEHGRIVESGPLRDIGYFAAMGGGTA